MTNYQGFPQNNFNTQLSNSSNPDPSANWGLSQPNQPPAPVATTSGGGKSSGNLVVTIVAVVVAFIAVIAAVFFALGGANKLGFGSSVPMRAAEIPQGFPADEYDKVPAAIATTLFACESGAEINNGMVDDTTSGTNCHTAINGEIGAAAFVSDEEWIQRALDKRETFDAYKELDVPGYTAYSFEISLEGAPTFHVITLISDGEKHYMDFVPTGPDMDFDVSDSDVKAFEENLLDAFKS